MKLRRNALFEVKYGKKTGKCGPFMASEGSERMRK
jgi:hypothetical protein